MLASGGGLRSVELFAGAGGLALGTSLAGFEPLRVVEWDRWACDTIRENQRADYPLVRSWDVEEGDIRLSNWEELAGQEVDLVSGGPPCQPFSMGGKARAADDSRDMFPGATEVIRTLRPRAFILENVKGLTRSAFANYFQYILLRLEHPELVSRDGETWLEHLHRLQSEHTSVSSDLRYNVVPTVVNAADYGVPQQRHRVFMVGFRSDVDAEWSFPDATHGPRELAFQQHVTGDYWTRNHVARRDRLEARPGQVAGLRRAHETGELQLLPWRTVRDALSGLPEPTRAGSRQHLNHVLQDGARPYPGHTGSYVDAPAKTLKAGDHGVPGGENMLRRPDGSVRYFTIREAARLQTFPDRYELHGSWTEAMRQLGNAVPVLLGEVVAASVAEHLALAEMRTLSARVRRRVRSA